MKHIFILFISLISGFLIGQPLAGTYTIGGSNPDYTTFSAADRALDSLGINGPVTFNFRDGVYVDDVLIDSIAGTSDTSWVTFQSESGDSSTVIIKGYTGGSYNGVVAAFKAQYLRFKSLTFEEPDATERAIILSRGHSFEVLNCVIQGSSTTVHDDYLMSIAIDSNLLVKNCLFTGSRQDITSFVTYGRSNVTIQNCDFHGGVNALRVKDIRNLEISNCNFYGTYDGLGIRRMILIDGVRGMTMVNNFIDGSRTYRQGYALEIRTTSGFDTVFIMNNVILSAANNSFGNAAVLFGNATGGLVDDIFAHNTIRFKSTNPNHSVFRSQRCYLPGVKLYNNIIVNESGGYLFDTCAYPTDYNLLYTSGAISPADSSLAQHQQSGRDQHSVFALPQFDTLLPGLSHAPEIDSAGFPFHKFPKDYADNFRDPQYPDIGPYEFINPPVVRFPQDTTVCTDVALDAGNPGSTFLWSTGDTTQTIVIDSAASYWVTATNSKGSNTDTIQVNIDSLVLPSYQVQASFDSLCTGGCIDLSTTLDSSQYQLVWSDTTGVIGIGAAISDCPLYLPKTYYLQISDSGVCQEFDSITVYPKNTLPVISSTVDTTICHGDSILLSVTSTDSIESVYWTVSAQPVGNGTPLWVKPDSLTLYEVQVNHANGCIGNTSTEVDIHYVSPPVISLSFDTLSVPDNWASYEWQLNGNPVPLATDTFLIAPQNGNYTVKVTDSTGCNVTSPVFTFNRFDIAEIPSHYLKLYPNPAGQHLTIEVSPLIINPGFKVYNSIGKLLPVEVNAKGAHTYQLNVEAFQPGVYFLHMASEGTIMVRKFVKE